MATKIRLQRHGKKRNAYYYIVVADSRVKRDGKYIERLGSYNPNTNPATIDLNFDNALKWVKTGAEPTNTARAILSYKGVLMKHHLDKGVGKGAHTQEQADAKFEQWLTEKGNKITSKVEALQKVKDDENQKRFEAEKAINDQRLADIQAKEAEMKAAEEAAAAEATASEETEATAEETAPAAEEATEENKEA